MKLRRLLVVSWLLGIVSLEPSTQRSSVSRQVTEVTLPIRPSTSIQSPSLITCSSCRLRPPIRSFSGSWAAKPKIAVNTAEVVTSPSRSTRALCCNSTTTTRALTTSNSRSRRIFGVAGRSRSFGNNSSTSQISRRMITTASNRSSAMATTSRRLGLVPTQLKLLPPTQLSNARLGSRQGKAGQRRRRQRRLSPCSSRIPTAAMIQNSRTTMGEGRIGRHPDCRIA